jgi:hypothetical protein
MNFAGGLVQKSFGVIRLVGEKEETWKSGWSSVRMGGGDMRGSMGSQGKRVII